MKNQQEYRMYDNPVLEKLSQTNPPMMIAFHFILVSGIFAFSVLYKNYISAGVFLIAFLVGFLFWTFGEYVLHRWVFHFTNELKFIQHFHRAMHGYHHDFPRDDKRLFMPPVPAIIFLTFFFGLFFLFMGNYAWGFLPGFEIGYLVYSLIHYSIHTKRPPKMFKHLWRHHSLHHYKYPDLAFGVSNTFWDRIFGTMPPSK